MRQDWSDFNRQYNQYQHICMDFFNIIQPAWDTKWIIAGDEAHNKDLLDNIAGDEAHNKDNLRVKMFAEHLKTA